MSDFPDVSSSIASFENMPRVAGWPEQRVIDVLIRESIERLFEMCRDDARAWLSDADLQGMLFSILRQHLPQHGLSASAVHCQTQVHLPTAGHNSKEHRPRSFRADISVLVPRSVDPASPENGGEIAAIIQVCRSFKVDTALEPLVRLAKTKESPLIYLVIVAHKELESDATRVRQMGTRHNIPVMALNYWGKDKEASMQPELL